MLWFLRNPPTFCSSVLMTVSQFNLFVSFSANKPQVWKSRFLWEAWKAGRGFICHSLQRKEQVSLIITCSPKAEANYIVTAFICLLAEYLSKQWTEEWNKHSSKSVTYRHWADVVVAGSQSQHILRVWHLMLLNELALNIILKVDVLLDLRWVLLSEYHDTFISEWFIL